MRCRCPLGVGLAVAVAAMLAAAEARAQCPVGTVITVDYDIPGSGYSETSSNWETYGSATCNGPTYRYLSLYVAGGDGTRRGSATFQPTIGHAGYWRFRTGYRATENRTSDADYFAYDDSGATTHTVVNQQGDGSCHWVDLGVHYCEPGGVCRVVLDGTDDGQSDCADVTTFTLESCEALVDAGVPDAGPAQRCDGIRAVAAYEVCEETATTCAGVYTNGAGCVAYCGAAGMTCVARYGGSPGCLKEPNYPIACNAVNGEQSNWCECEGPPLPDAGTGGAGASPATGGAAGAPSTGGATGVGGNGAFGPAPGDGGGGDAQGASGGISAQGASAGSPGAGTAAAVPQEDSGCGCRVPAGAPRRPGGALLLGLLLLWQRRRRMGMRFAVPMG